MGQESDFAGAAYSDPLGLISGQFAQLIPDLPIDADIWRSMAKSPDTPPEDGEKVDEPAAVDVTDEMPRTAAEMVDGFMTLIWQQRKNLKGTALTQALIAMSKLAESARDRPAETNVQVDVLDLIKTEGLLPERKRELLEAEFARTRDRMIRIDEELAALEAQP